MILVVLIGFFVPALLILAGIEKVVRRSRCGTRIQFGLRELLAIPIALLPLLLTQPVGANRTALVAIVASFLIYQLAGILWGWLIVTSNPAARLGWKPALAIVMGGWLGVVVELLLAATLQGRQL